MKKVTQSLQHLFWILLFVVGAASGLEAQAQPDSCTTDSLIINTGWDYSTNSLGTIGSYSSAWQVISDPSPNTTEPRPAVSVAPDSAWDGPRPGSNWISTYPSARNDTNGVYTLQFCFCIVRPVRNVRISFDILADDRATIYLNGTQIGATTMSYAFLADSMTTVTANISALVVPGENCLTVELENTNNVAMGLDISGSITASGLALQDPSCCNDSTAILTGMKFEDLDCDGIRDPGEPGLSGWQIVLSNGDTATTDALGNYYFYNLPPGLYTLSEIQQAPWVQTYPSFPGTHSVSLANGQVIGSLDFGNCDTTRTESCFEIRNDTTICLNDGILTFTQQFEIRSLIPCGAPQSATFVSLNPNITIFPGNAAVSSTWSQVNLVVGGPGAVQGATVDIEVTVCCYDVPPGTPPICCTDTLTFVLDCGGTEPCLEVLNDTIACFVDPHGLLLYDYNVEIDAQLPCPDPVLQGTFTVISPATGVTVSPPVQPVFQGVGVYNMTISGPGATPGTLVGIEVELCCFDPATGINDCCLDTLWVELPECPGETCEDCCKDFPKSVVPLQYSFGNGTSIVGGLMSAGTSKICTVSATLVSASINGQPVAGTFTPPVNLGGQAGTIPFMNEVIWTGVDVNAGPTPFGIRINFPPVNTQNGRDVIRYCIRFRFTDANCVTCDTVICFRQRRRRWFFFDRPDRPEDYSIAPDLSEELEIPTAGTGQMVIDDLIVTPLREGGGSGSNGRVQVELRASGSGLPSIQLIWEDQFSTEELPINESVKKGAEETNRHGGLKATQSF